MKRLSLSRLGKIALTPTNIIQLNEREKAVIRAAISDLRMAIANLEQVIARIEQP